MAEPQSSSPRVSVISIFYNAETYFQEAIESVLAQEFSDFELLLVDDGSTDRSTEIAQDYVMRQPDRIRYLEHEDHANRGMSATRNLGLKHARGEFVAFIDADDRWRPAKLREQVDLLDRMPDVDALGGSVNYWGSHNGGVDRIVPTGHVRNRPLSPPEAFLCVYPLGRAAAPCPSDLIVRRSAALEVGGFEESFVGNLQMYEDQAFLAKIYLSKTIYFTDRVWLDYRVHDQSCVSRVNRAGGYANVRGSFLQWLDGYLDRNPVYRSPQVNAALHRSRSQSRFPAANRLMRWGSGALRKAFA